MKKAALLMIMMALTSSSCNMFTPASSIPTALPQPSATPDPCSAENILEEMRDLQGLVNEFQDIAYIANFTPQAQLIDPILRLQATRRETQQLEVPSCQQTLQEATINYMGAVINYLAFFMGGETTENVDAGIQNSQLLWQTVIGEFNKLATTAGVEALPLPEFSSVAPPAESPSALVSNNRSQGVNVRARPDTNAAILVALEPGMSALAIGRTGAGDWIQINLNGTIGWVFTETITTNFSVIDLPMVEELP